MAKLDTFLSLDYTRVKGWEAQSKERIWLNQRKGRDQILQRSLAQP